MSVILDVNLYKYLVRACEKCTQMLKEKFRGSGWEWTKTLRARAVVERACCGSGVVLVRNSAGAGG